jgi:hypothetical protein
MEGIGVVALLAKHIHQGVDDFPSPGWGVVVGGEKKDAGRAHVVIK